MTIPFFKVVYKHLFCMLQYGIVDSKCPTDIFNALKFTEVKTHYKMDSMRIHSVYFTVRSTFGIICILCTSSHQVSYFSLLNIIDNNFMLTSNLLLLLFTQSQVKPWKLKFSQNVKFACSMQECWKTMVKCLGKLRSIVALRDQTMNFSFCRATCFYL